MTTELSLSQQAKKLTEEFASMGNEQRTQFLTTAPVKLVEFFKKHGIESQANNEQLQALINFQGICGGPRNYFFIKVNNADVELVFTQLVSLSCNAKVLAQFVEHFDEITELCKEVESSRQQPFMKGEKQYNGDIFYSDIELFIGNKFNKMDFRSIVYHVLCDYLRAVNIWVHS